MVLEGEAWIRLDGIKKQLLETALAGQDSYEAVEREVLSRCNGDLLGAAMANRH
jgi:hypothetical protein